MLHAVRFGSRFHLYKVNNSAANFKVSIKPYFEHWRHLDVKDLFFFFRKQQSLSVTLKCFPEMSFWESISSKDCYTGKKNFWSLRLMRRAFEFVYTPLKGKIIPTKAFLLMVLLFVFSMPIFTTAARCPIFMRLQQLKLLRNYQLDWALNCTSHVPF